MALTLEKINKNILAVNSQIDDKDFVAVAVFVNDKGEGQHSGLIIGVEEDLYLFHYTGREIELNNSAEEGEWYFFKTLDIIKEEEVLSFLHHCELINENTPTPTYGFVFDGSYFIDGQYYSESGIKHFTTCVGFCINVIKGFIHNQDDYLNLDDWNVASTQTEEFRNNYMLKFLERNLAELEKEYPEKIEEIKANYIKRITPSEMTSSAFFDKLPIPKSDIDGIIGNVCLTLYNKRLN